MCSSNHAAETVRFNITGCKLLWCLAQVTAEERPEHAASSPDYLWKGGAATASEARGMQPESVLAHILSIIESVLGARIGPEQPLMEV